VLQNLTFLTSLGQWAIFFGIVTIIFGWIEKKGSFVYLGLLSFLILGLIAAWIVFADVILVPQTLQGIISKQEKALSFFKLSAIFGSLSGICLLQRFLKFKFQTLTIAFLFLFALFLFFMIFKIQQMPN
jgi:hypothetical protein